MRSLADPAKDVDSPVLVELPQIGEGRCFERDQHLGCFTLHLGEQQQVLITWRPEAILG